MGIGKFLLGLIGAGGAGAATRFATSKLATVGFLGGPAGGAIIGAGLFAASYFLRANREEDKPDLWEPQTPNNSGNLWRRIILGEARTGGINVDFTIDRENRSLKTVWVLGDGEYDALVGMEINGQEIKFESPVQNGQAIISDPVPYMERMNVWAHFTGSGEYDTFRNDYSLPGIAYIVIEQTQPEDASEDFWERDDIPNVRFRVRGQKINGVFSSNPVVCAKWWLEHNGIEATAYPGAEAYCDEVLASAVIPRVPGSVFDSESFRVSDEIFWQGSAEFYNLSGDPISSQLFGGGGIVPAIPAELLAGTSDESFSYVRVSVNGLYIRLLDTSGRAQLLLDANKALIIRRVGTDYAVTLSLDTARRTSAGQYDFSLTQQQREDVFPTQDNPYNVEFAIVNIGANSTFDSGNLTVDIVGDISHLEVRRYRFGAVIESNENLHQVIGVFERAMNGRITLNPDGTATIYAGQAIATTATINKNDAIGEPILEIISNPGQFFNEITATARVEPYWDANEIKKTASAATTDGSIIVTKDVGSLRGIYSEIQAKRHLAYLLRRPQRMAAVTLTLPMEQGVALKLWQRVQYDSPEVSGVFRIASHPVPNVSENQCAITLVEDPNSIYSDSSEEVDLGPRRIVRRAPVPIPQNLSADSDALRQNDGNIIVQTGIQWNIPSKEILHCRVRHRITPSEVWINSYDGDAHGYAVIPDTPAGSTIEIQARFVNRSNRAGDWSEILSHMVIGDLISPSNVESLVAIARVSGILIQWKRPGDEDSRDYKDALVYSSADDNFDNVTLVGEGYESFFDDRGTEFDRQYYWVRARDNSNNLAAPVGPVSAEPKPEVNLDALQLGEEAYYRNAVQRPEIPTDEPPFTGWTDLPEDRATTGETTWKLSRSRLQLGQQVTTADWVISIYLASSAVQSDRPEEDDYNQIIYADEDTYRPLRPIIPASSPANDWDEQDGGIDGSFISDSDATTWSTDEPAGDHWFSFRTVTQVIFFIEEAEMVRWEQTHWSEPTWSGSGIPPGFRGAAVVVDNDNIIVIDENTIDASYPMTVTPQNGEVTVVAFSGNISNVRVAGGQLIFNTGDFPVGPTGSITLQVENHGFETEVVTIEVRIQNVLNDMMVVVIDHFDAQIANLNNGIYDIEVGVDPAIAEIIGLRVVGLDDVTIEDRTVPNSLTRDLRIHNPMLRVGLVSVTFRLEAEDYHDYEVSFTIAFERSFVHEDFEQKIYTSSAQHPGPVTNWPFEWNEQDGGFGPPNDFTSNAGTRWYNTPRNTVRDWYAIRVNRRITNIIEGGEELIEWQPRPWGDPVWDEDGPIPPLQARIDGLENQTFQTNKIGQNFSFGIWPYDAQVEITHLDTTGNLWFTEILDRNEETGRIILEGSTGASIGQQQITIVVLKDGYQSATQTIRVSSVANNTGLIKIYNGAGFLNDGEGNFYQLGLGEALPFEEQSFFGIESESSQDSSSVPEIIRITLTGAIVLRTGEGYNDWQLPQQSALVDARVVRAGIATLRVTLGNNPLHDVTGFATITKTRTLRIIESDDPEPDVIPTIDNVLPNPVDLEDQSNKDVIYDTIDEARIGFLYEGDAASFIRVVVIDDSGTRRSFNVARIGSTQSKAAFSNKRFKIRATNRDNSSLFDEETVRVDADAISTVVEPEVAPTIIDLASNIDLQDEESEDEEWDTVSDARQSIRSISDAGNYCRVLSVVNTGITRLFRFIRQNTQLGRGAWENKRFSVQVTNPRDSTKFSRQTVTVRADALDIDTPPQEAPPLELTGGSANVHLEDGRTVDGTFTTSNDASVAIRYASGSSSLYRVSFIGSGTNRTFQVTRANNRTAEMEFQNKEFTLRATNPLDTSKFTDVVVSVDADDLIRIPIEPTDVPLDGVPSRIVLGTRSSHTEQYTTSRNAQISFQYIDDAGQYLRAFVGSNNGTTRTFVVERLGSILGAGLFNKFVRIIASEPGQTPGEVDFEVIASQLPFQFVGLDRTAHIGARYSAYSDLFHTSYGTTNVDISEINANDQDYFSVSLVEVNASGVLRWSLRIVRQGTFGNAAFARNIVIRAEVTIGGQTLQIDRTIRVTSDTFDQNAFDPNDPEEPPDEA